MEIKITVSKCDDDTMVFDTDKFGPDTMRYVLTYGLKQSINDATAGCKTVADAREKARARRDAILKGAVRAGGGGGRRLDPLFVITRDIVAGMMDTSRADALKRLRSDDDVVTEIGNIVALKMVNAGKADTIDAARGTKGFDDVVRKNVSRIAALAERTLKDRASMSVDVA